MLRKTNVTKYSIIKFVWKYCCLFLLLATILITTKIGIINNVYCYNLFPQDDNFANLDDDQEVSRIDTTGQLKSDKVNSIHQLVANPELLGLIGNLPSTRQTYDSLGNDNRYSKPTRNEIYLLEDKDYPKSLFEDYPRHVGQVSGIAALPSGDVAIFHRADRQWTEDTFNQSSKSVRNQDDLIRNDTIMIIDREDGSSVTSFGSNLFYMPHSIASDNLGNLWVSDVARHQVMRLPTSMMQSNNQEQQYQQKRWLPGNMTRIWPDIILGEAFVPGNDRVHFCQPSEIAVSSDGRLVFVADGYCNRRVMVFTGSGKFLTSFGEENQMNVVHSLALIEEHNLVCVADRENARILCFKAGLDGDLSSIGELAYGINYPLGRVFAILAIGADHLLVSSNQINTNRYDLAILNPFTKELKLVWTSSDLLEPHSLARTFDGQYAYAADVSKEAYKKVFKFNIIQRKD